MSDNPKKIIKIVCSWDAESGAEINRVMALITLFTGQYVQAVWINETVYLVASDDWLATKECASLVIDMIRAMPSQPGPPGPPGQEQTEE